MAVRHRNADALRRNQRRAGLDDFAALDAAPDAQRLLLAFFFLAADVRNDVVQHFRPIGKVFAGPGNRLVRGDDHLGRLEVQQRMDGRYVALDGAVRLHGDKSGFGAQPFALRFDHLDMPRVDFRDDHRNVRGPAMGRIVGNDGRAGFCVRFFQRLNFILFHIDRAKNEIDLIGHFIHFRSVLHDDIFDGFRNRCRHFPPALHGFLIRFPR